MAVFGPEAVSPVARLNVSYAAILLGECYDPMVILDVRIEAGLTVGRTR